MPNWIEVVFPFAVIIVPIVAIVALLQKFKERRFIDSYKNLQPGMTKSKICAILGSEFTGNYLSDGTEVLEWELSRGIISHGRRVRVKFKNAKAIEITSSKIN